MAPLGVTEGPLSCKIVVWWPRCFPDDSRIFGAIGIRQAGHHDSSAPVSAITPSGGRDVVNGLEMATAERTELADLLATLTPAQWEVPSLCVGWRVRDVVAHVMSFDGVTPRAMLRRVIRGRIVHANQVAVDELASLTTEQLLHKLRTHLRPQGLATTFGGRLALLDVTIHHQDIRRPLGMPRQIPAERLRWVLPDSVRSPELPGWRLAEVCAWRQPIWTGGTARDRRSRDRQKPC
ncbi:maleylpyruvate isomerase family mycothiol-dependent enzyme [Microlunatus ginsengisoli]|uniref:Mycothiol-dependent maleylpyruvate isomerase metal-binding domain-containing protein n=1 Tax=Microlunatus ginsengisoli TaxID=363863 RepID=A0ABP6ZGR7_9ACTN